jgi:hypothetical protein
VDVYLIIYMGSEIKDLQKELIPDQQVESLFIDLVQKFQPHPVDQVGIAITLEDIIDKIPKTGWQRIDTQEDRKNNANLKAHYMLSVDNPEGQPDEKILIEVWWRGDITYDDYLLQLTQNIKVPPTTPETIEMQNKPTGAQMVVQTENGNIYHFVTK